MLRLARKPRPGVAAAQDDDVESVAPADAVPPPAPALAAAPLDREPDRFELKYWIPEELTHKIVEYLRPYLVLEPFAVKLGLVQQVNMSLYFETRYLDAYRTHTDKAADRYKLRIRAYGDPPRGVTFFETKRKVNTRCVKTRTLIPMEQMKALLDGNYRQLPANLSPTDRRHLEMFLYAKEVSQAEPFMLVRASRESYCSEDPLEDIRLTIDRQICFQRAKGNDFTSDPDAWVPIDGEDQHGQKGSHAMVELKFPGIAPFWMRKLVDRLEMWRTGYSKFISGVQYLLDEEALNASAWDFSGD